MDQVPFVTIEQYDVASIEAPPLLIAAGPPIDIKVTHYGIGFNGQTLGCGNGYYTSENETIVAVGPERHSEWPCGTPLQVCGQAGCISASRQDGCPGCSANVLDLSEAGIGRVCGDNASVCDAHVVEMEYAP
ncbi:MAG TPA: hypothetical protein VI759_02745 [Dehalococcoidia bacterium]|nr:hypothetical protein [Dehalococcoidia bacterium]